jgi:hypothetical protein
MQAVLNATPRAATRAVAALLVLLLTALAIVMTAVPAFACSCAPSPPPAQAAEEADAVFAGEVVDIQRAGEFEVEVVLAVSDVWKGGISERQVIRTGSDGAMCGFSFQGGEAYLVYASKGDDGFRTSSCSRTAPLSAADADVAVLGDAYAPAAGSGEPAAAGTSPWLLAGAAALVLAAGGALVWQRRRTAGA